MQTSAQTGRQINRRRMSRKPKRQCSECEIIVISSCLLKRHDVIYTQFFGQYVYMYLVM